MEIPRTFVAQSHPNLPSRDHSSVSRLKDYARAGQRAFPQRAAIYTTSLFFAGFYYDQSVAIIFFALILASEIYDTLVLRRIRLSTSANPINVRTALIHTGVVTFLSATTVALFCIAIAIQQGTDGNHFLPLFLLVSASIFAAMNNHQFIPILAVRLTIYIGAILFIPIRDVWIERPPIHSELWLNLFTVLFVLGFIVELARSFLKGYSASLKSRHALQIEHKHALAANEAKTRFLATVSHELRTPLTSIKGSLDIINSGRLGAPPDNMARLLDMAGRNSNRLNDLVGDLLLLQTSDAGKLSLNMAKTDLGEVVLGAVQSFQSYAGGLGVKVECDVRLDKHFVHGDKKRLDQVINNLLSNAAKFSDTGDIVRVSLRRVGAKLELSVRDQGIGIPAGSETTVFEEFGQIDSSDQRKFQGTGLGLSISRRIIEAHGGSISYDSVLGKGTTFRFMLEAVG